MTIAGSSVNLDSRDGRPGHRALRLPPRVMKSALLSLILALYLCFSGCVSGGRVPGPPDRAETFVVKKAGPTGGTISWKGLEVSVPANALTGESDLMVSLSSPMDGALPRPEPSGNPGTPRVIMGPYRIDPVEAVYAVSATLAFDLLKAGTPASASDEEASASESPHPGGASTLPGHSSVPAMTRLFPARWEPGKDLYRPIPFFSVNSVVTGFTLKNGWFAILEWDGPAGASPPVLEITSPSVGEETVRNRYTVHFRVSGAGPGATVDLMSDPDGGGFDGELIAARIPVAAGYHEWDLIGVPTGVSHVYGVLSDAGYSAYSYAPGSLRIISADLTLPRLVSVTHSDAEGTSSFTAGDRTDFGFDEMMNPDRLALIAADGLGMNFGFGLGTGRIEGTFRVLSSALGAFEKQGGPPAGPEFDATLCAMTLSSDGKTVTITLGGTVDNSGDEPGGTFTPSGKYLADIYGNFVSSKGVTVTGFWKDRVRPVMTGALMVDAGTPIEITAGDYMEFTFSEPVAVAPIKAAAAAGLTGPIADSGFAAGSGTLAGTWRDLKYLLGDFTINGTFIASDCTMRMSQDRTLITIELGGNISNTINPPREFFMPSPENLLDDSGNPLDDGVTPRVTGSWLDVVQPMLLSVEYTDGGSPGDVAPGDAMVLVFSEAMSETTLMNMAAFNKTVRNVGLAPGSGYLEGEWSTLASSLGYFGTTGTFNAPTSKIYLSDDRKRIDLVVGGTVFNAFDRSGGEFTPSGVYLTDRAGNSISRTQLVPTGSWAGSAEVRMTSLTLVDGGTPDTISAGDSMVMAFDRPVSVDLLKWMVLKSPGIADNGLTAGAGFLLASFVDFMKALGTFSFPGFFNSSPCELRVSADMREVTITLGGLIVEEKRLFSGPFTPSPSFLKDQPGNPVTKEEINVAGAWSIQDRPTVTGVTLTDVGTTGPESGDTVTFGLSEALSVQRLAGMAGEISGVADDGLLTGGTLRGTLAGLLSGLGSFSVPGDVTATNCTLGLTDADTKIVITLGGSVAGKTSPSGSFTPVVAYIYDVAGNPVDTGEIASTVGSFGYLPTIAGLSVSHVTTGIRRGDIRISFFMTAPEGSYDILLEGDTGSGFSAVDAKSVYPGLDGITGGTHEIYWAAASSMPSGSIPTRGSLGIRLTGQWDDGTHGGDPVTAGPFGYVDTRPFMPMSGSWVYNDETIDPLDAGGSTGDSTQTVRQGTPPGPVTIGDGTNSDRWSAGVFEISMLNWHAGDGDMTAGREIVLNSPGPVLPLIALTSQTAPWRVTSLGSINGVPVSGILCTHTIVGFDDPPPANPAWHQGRVITIRRAVEHPSLPGGGVLTELTLAENVGVLAATESSGAYRTLKSH